MTDQARVTFNGTVVTATADVPVTFGRAVDNDLCLDEHDTGVSRRSGLVELDHGTCWVRNTSATRALSIVDDHGFRSVLPPGRRVAVESATRVMVDRASGRPITLLVEPVGVPTPEPVEAAGTGVATAVGEQVVISDSDRLAMVALFAGYLEEPPRYDPYPKSYAAAAARLGWPRTTLVKRIEYLRARLDAAGVPNMTGWTALTNLAEYAISRHLITRADLDLLAR
jgi:hypothetical protein